MLKILFKTAAVALLAWHATGCEKNQKPPSTSASQVASVTLRIAVAEDAQLAEAIARLRGEWAEQSGGEMVVDSRATAEVLSGASLQDESSPPPDLIIFPSRYLGELCEQGQLRPMRDSTLRREELAFTDFYPLIREREIVYGKRVMALPVGCPTPLLISEPGPDDNTPPAIWGDLPENVAHESLGEVREGLQWAYLYLARAASYAAHPSRQALLFDPKTLAPRLAEPPFERAMQELTAMASKAPLVGDRITTDNSLLGMGGRPTVVWPVRSQERVFSNPSDQAQVADARKRLTTLAETLQVTPLPGTNKVFSPVSLSWEPVEAAPQRVTLLATSGRLIGVTATSRNAASAFRLAAWLAGKQNSRQLATASSATANPRQSLARVADDWSGIGSASLGAEFSRAHAKAMRGTSGFVVPRLIQVDSYLAALSDAVKEVGAKSISPRQALDRVTAEWEALTEAVGRDRQVTAYRRHLGLADFEPPKR